MAYLRSPTSPLALHDAKYDDEDLTGYIDAANAHSKTTEISAIAGKVPLRQFDFASSSVPVSMSVESIQGQQQEQEIGLVESKKENEVGNKNGTEAQFVLPRVMPIAVNGDKDDALVGFQPVHAVDVLVNNLSRKLSFYADVPTAKNNEVFCVKFDGEGQYLATGSSDGVVRVYNVKGQQQYELKTSQKVPLPCTAIKFRPAIANAKTKNVVLVANADGSIDHWHMTSGKLLYKTKEENNQVYSIDYSPDGMNFCSAGRDTKVRVYEEATKACLLTLGASEYKSTPGHSNRVFAVKYKPDDPNVILSGGWDNTVQFWDIRAECSVRSIYGPHICGDALDIKDGKILTGSWRPEKALQLWDFGTGRLIRDIEWTSGMGSVSIGENAMLYTAQFSPDGTMIAAGGTGTRDVRIFDVASDYQLLGRMKLGQQGVYTLDFSPNSHRLAVGGNSDTIAIREIIAAH